MSGYEVVDLGDMVVTEATPVVSGPAGPAGPAFDPAPLLELIGQLTTRVEALDASAAPVLVEDPAEPGLYATGERHEDPAAPGLYPIGA